MRHLRTGSPAACRWPCLANHCHRSRPMATGASAWWAWGSGGGGALGLGNCEDAAVPIAAADVRVTRRTRRRLAACALTLHSGPSSRRSPLVAVTALVCNAAVGVEAGRHKCSTVRRPDAGWSAVQLGRGRVWADRAGGQLQCAHLLVVFGFRGKFRAGSCAKSYERELTVFRCRESAWSLRTAGGGIR